MFEEINSYLYLVVLAWLVATSQTVVSFITQTTLRINASWMFRVLLVPVLLSVLLLFRAAELYWIFLLQFLTILGVNLAIEFRAKRAAGKLGGAPDAAKANSRGTYSLATLLFLTSIVGGVLGLLRITPEQNLRSICSLFLIGVTAGVVGAGSHFFFNWTRKDRLRTRIGKQSVWILLAAVSCIPLVLMDKLLAFSFGLSWDGWPPNPTPLMSTSLLVNAVWVPIAIVHSWLMLVWLSSVSAFNKGATGKTLCLLTSFAILAFPAFTLIHLLKPLNRHQIDFASNSYREILKLGSELKDSEFGRIYDAYTEWDQVPKAELVLAVTDAERYLAKLTPLINQECQVPLSYTWDDIDVDAVGIVRLMANATVAKSRVEMDFEPNRACETLMQGIKLTTRVRRGGLFIHTLVAIAASGGVRAELVENRRYFSQARGLAAARELLELVDTIEPPNVVEDRERTWSRACHWTSNIGDGVSRLLGVDLFETASSCKDAMLTELAELRLAAVALALEAFHKEYSRYPATLNELSEKLQFLLPADPYSSTQQTFVYQLTEIGYSIYSLGPNRIDDGGVHDLNDFHMFRHDIPLLGIVNDPTNVPTISPGGPY